MPVTFDENEVPVRASSAKHRVSFSEFLIKNGVVKTERGAQILLIVVAVILIGIFLYTVSSSSVKIEPPSPEEYLVD